jgi:hypothetical protein
MEFLNDWKLWITLGTVVVNIVVLATIKFNDLLHLGRAVKLLTTKVDHMDTRVDKLSERVAKVEGKLEKH